MKIYAIIETGGKQYRVTLGQTIEVEKLGVSEGKKVDLDKVLLIAADDKLTVGTPTIEGAKVVATSQGNIKGEKAVIYRYKSKSRYHRKAGHRQPYTRLVIDKIVGPGMEKAEPVKKVRRRKKEVSESGA